MVIFVESFDQAIWNGAQSARGPVLDAVYTAFSVVGSLPVLAVLTLGIVVWQARRPRVAVLAVVTLVGAVGLSTLTKFAVDRPRPEVFVVAVAVPGTPSFPSGTALHAAAVLSFAGRLIETTTRHRRLAVGATPLLILLIGMSRFAVGVNYPSDVLFGCLAGWLWGWACWRAVGPAEKLAAADVPS